MLVALHLRQDPAPASASATGSALGILGLAMIVLPVFLFEEAMEAAALWLMVPTTGAALVIVHARGAAPAARLLASPALVGVGLISYSAYLWHQPLFAFAHHGHLADQRPWLPLTLGLAAFPLAYLSWRYVECPFRDRSRFELRQIGRAAIAASVAFAAVGTAAALSDGFRGRFTEAANTVADRMRASPLRGACHADDDHPVPPAAACRYYGARVTRAVIGDSHAVELAQAFARLIEPRAEGIVHLSYSGGFPALDFPEYPELQAYWKSVLGFLRDSPEIRDVIVVFRHSNYLTGDMDEHYPKLPDSTGLSRVRGSRDEIRQRYWNSFARLISDLLESGKRVVVVRPVPELGRPVANLIYGLNHPNERDYAAVAGIARDDYERRNAEFNRRLNGLPPNPLLLSYDPSERLCDADTCYAVKDALPLYIDSHHLSLDGAVILAEGILDLLDQSMKEVAARGAASRPR